MSSEKTIAENVRFFRARLKLTQIGLADKAAISKQYVAKIEAGNGNVTLEVLDQLANALGVTTGQLVTKVEIQSQAA